MLKAVGASSISAHYFCFFVILSSSWNYTELLPLEVGSGMTWQDLGLAV